MIKIRRIIKEGNEQEVDKAATEKHLAAAEKLLSQHNTDHLTPHHRKHFTTYLNRTTRTNTARTTDAARPCLSSDRR